MVDLFYALTLFSMQNLIYALTAIYMDILYFTFNLRITAVLYKHPTLHVPSDLSSCYMTSLMVQYEIVFKIKSSPVVS